MQLVADRFAVSDSEDAIDLATGNRVELLTSTVGGVLEQARWAERCARFAGLRHRSIAPLVDYGLMGDVQRFEAWDCQARWMGDRAFAERARDAATVFLCASGLTSGVMPFESFRLCNGGVAILPSADAGYASTPPEAEVPRFALLDALGMSVLSHGVVTSLAELFLEIDAARLRIVGLWGPPGSGRGSAIAQLARTARLAGYVPLSPCALTRDVLPLLAKRSILLIVRSDARAGWRAFMTVSIHAPKPHVVLFAGDDDVPSVRAITLGRFPVDVLAGAVQPARLAAAHRRSIVAAARRARGLPGRFVRLLWGGGCCDLSRTRTPGLRAAESSAVYHARRLPTEDSPVKGPREWPAPGELAVLRRRLVIGAAQLERGRHARGDRTLRQAIGGLTRRADWLHAARGALVVCASLIRRGKTADARALLAEARQLAVRSERDDLLAHTATLIGMAAMEEVQLEEAESILTAAVASARGFGDTAGARSAAFELARCLFWRGQYHAAVRALAWIDSEHLETDALIRLHIVRSRAALGRGDLADGVSQATSAVTIAEQSTPRLVAAAAYAAALAHLVVGDRAAVDHDLACCIRASRAAHDPLFALRARLLSAESRRRGGDRAHAAALVGRLRRMGSRHVPAIVRARCDLLAALLREDQGSEVAERHANASGLGALRLFAPSSPRQGTALSGVNDVLEILRCCETADDENVLSSICSHLRTKLRADAVAFVVEERGQPIVLSSRGGRIDGEIPMRVHTMGEPIAPHAVRGRVEGGVPVRYGGRPIGALVARWLDASSCDSAESVALLTTAAVAAAPALAHAAARRVAQPGERSDLLGASAAMSEVRLAVERAASAPFPVLIEGESGSGKELVARALHRRSPRRSRPWCTLNCAALPEELIEAELFGHARGAFTGALVERLGVFEEAHGGTLFLDEVGELSLRAQAKVLRTVQEGELRRIGENVARRVDVRLVAATNRDLRQDVAAGRFRLDLLYRLDVVRIALPPLRSRREDIPELAEHFWRQATERMGSRAVLGAAVLAALARYDWPGNVRELHNVLAALVVRCPKRGVVLPSALPAHFDAAEPRRSWRLDEARQTFEASFVRAALARCGGHRSRAAEELGVTRQGLTKLLARLGLGLHDQSISDAVAPSGARPMASDWREPPS